MDKLSVKELKLMCKGFNLPTTGRKADIVSRIMNHLPNCVANQSDDVDDESENEEHCERVTVIGRIKTRIINPLLGLADSMKNRTLNLQTHSWATMLALLSFLFLFWFLLV